MEVLLIACMLAWAAGAQSEQSKLGLAPAQRASLREQTRHQKAVQKIADKYGGSPPDGRKAGASPWKEPAAAPSGPAPTLPAAFASGYRGHSPVRRVATPMGRRVGGMTARGVAWTADTGKGAVREYRKRRRAGGHADPAPVLVPLPPSHPPVMPPIPAEAPKAGAGSGKGVSLKKPEEKTTGPDPAATAGKKAEKEADPPATASPPTTPTPAPPKPPDPIPAKPAEPPATEGGAGRMAAEVTYESVKDESDDLSLMCDDDVRVYGRIGKRCRREIGRGDDLIAAMEAVGFGPKVIGWVVRGREQYQVIDSHLGELTSNTVAQGESVVKAKALLEAGQGVYADIAQDMESVAERDVYISDAVDAEDTNAHTEVYETKGV